MPLKIVELIARQRSFGLDRDNRALSQPRGYVEPRPLGRVVYANEAASAVITNSTAELAFDKKFALPANTLRPGMVVKVRYQGVVVGSNATDTILARLRMGGVAGTVLLAGTAIDAVNGMIFGGEWEGIVRSIGAAGKIVGIGTHIETPAASGTAVHDVAEALAETTINTTIDQMINATAQWSVANAANQARLEFMRVEVW